MRRRCARYRKGPRSHDQAVQGDDQHRRPRFDTGLGAVHAAPGAGGRAERALHRPRRCRLLGDGAVGRADRDPNINKLAANGLTYTNWHTTALCSPTRSSLLTGRNHTTNGMACIAEATSGLPRLERAHPLRVRDDRRGARRARLEHLHARQVAPLSRRRDEHGVDQAQLAGGPRLRALLRLPRRRDEPVVSRTSSTTTTTSTSRRWPEEGYHLTEDLTDKAIEFIRDAKVVAPDKPFFMYFCPGACHAPHHAPTEWIEKYKGRFDMGYERVSGARVRTSEADGHHARQTPSSRPLNPYAEETSLDGKPWNPVDVDASLGLPLRRREEALRPDG